MLVLNMKNDMKSEIRYRNEYAVRLAPKQIKEFKKNIQQNINKYFVHRFQPRVYTRFT